MLSRQELVQPITLNSKQLARMTVSDSYVETFERQEHLEYLSNTKKPLDNQGHCRKMTRQEYLEFLNKLRSTATRAKRAKPNQN